jgi:hypothetical protein
MALRAQGRESTENTPPIRRPSRMSTGALDFRTHTTGWAPAKFGISLISRKLSWGNSAANAKGGVHPRQPADRLCIEDLRSRRKSVCCRSAHQRPDMPVHGRPHKSIRSERGTGQGARTACRHDIGTRSEDSQEVVETTLRHPGADAGRLSRGARHQGLNRCQIP